MKKVFIVSAILLVFFLFFLGIYNFFFEKADNSNNSVKIYPEENKFFGQKKKDSEEKIYPLSNEAVISPAVSATEDRLVYFLASNGNTYEASFEGEDKALMSSDEITGIKEVIWSPQKDKSIAVSNNEAGQQLYMYDYGQDIGKNLKPGITYANWTNAGDKIVYSYLDSQSQKTSINIADPDGSNWSELTGIDYQDVKIASVPTTTLVSFWKKPDANTETALATVPFVGGETKEVFSGKKGADYLWSPDGKKSLISHVSDTDKSKMVLGLIDNTGSGYQDLLIPTFVSKCTWSKNGGLVYCAFPTGIPKEAILPNDYMEGKFRTQDTLWKVSIQTGKKERIIEPEDMKDITIDATNLFLSPEGEALFLVNRIDGKLYRVNL